MSSTGAGGTKKKFKGAAYTLNVIQDMLEKVPEPARTVCAAAFTGVSASELRGSDGRITTQRTRPIAQKVGGKTLGSRRRKRETAQYQ